MEETIEKDLPEEAHFLLKYDVFRQGVQELVDMPEKTMNLLFRFLRQNEGQLSKRARENEFSHLSDSEVLHIEKLYAKIAE